MELMQTVSRRVFLTLPDGVADDLERWAASERNKAATLAGFIVEKAVREARQEGKIPSDPNYKSFSDLLTRNWDALAAYDRISGDRLEKLKAGEHPTDLEVARIALALRLDEQYIEQLTGGS
jgi:CopG-like RHH_1 or ribbon-helix-helix domain, RHH_5